MSSVWLEQSHREASWFHTSVSATGKIINRTSSSSSLRLCTRPHVGQKVKITHSRFVLRSVKSCPTSQTWSSWTWAPTLWQERPWSRDVPKPSPGSDASSSTTLRCPGTLCWCSPGRYLSKKLTLIPQSHWFNQWSQIEAGLLYWAGTS